MTLKMLTLYPEACTTHLYEDASGWACRTELPARVSAWDRRAYPGHRTVVTLDGSSRELIELSFREAPQSGVVYKLHQLETVRLAVEAGARKAATFISETSAPAAPASRDPSVECRGAADAQTVEALARNGYTADEVAEHLGRGARIFVRRAGALLASVCMVFPNYDTVWEIGGVWTSPEQRRQGHARAVVTAALGYLSERGLRPRYQYRAENTASAAVARSVGLRPALTVEHWLRT